MFYVLPLLPRGDAPINQDRTPMDKLCSQEFRVFKGIWESAINSHEDDTELQSLKGEPGEVQSRRLMSLSQLGM